MSSLLTCSVSPTTVFVSSESGRSQADLTLTVQNKTADDITFGAHDYLLFTIPIQNGVPQLTDVALTQSAGDINPVSEQETWTIQADSVGSNLFRAYAKTPPTLLKAGASIAFVLKSITVARATGQAEITVQQKIGTNPQQSGLLPLQLSKSVLGITDFQAFPVSVSPGGAAKLSWQTTAAETLTLSCKEWSLNHKDDGLPFNGDYLVSPNVDTAYTLTVTGKEANLSRQVMVGVLRPQILNCQPDPLPSVDQGESVTLTFTTEFATYGVLSTAPMTHIPISPPNSGTQTVQVPVTPWPIGFTVSSTESMTFTVFSADGRFSSLPWALSFPSNPVAINYFRPREPVSYGDSFVLEWNLKNWTHFEVSVDGKVLSQIPQSATSFSITPTQDTTEYTMTAFQQQGQTMASVTATIIPAVPVGTVVPFYGSVISLPSGWLACDGETISAADYPKLTKFLGNNKTPDLRGYFLRGIDPTGQVDPVANRAVGNVQSDAFKLHDHATTVNNGSYNLGTSDKRYSGGGADSFGSGGNLRTSKEGDVNETRPKNVAVNYIIYAGVKATA